MFQKIAQTFSVSLFAALLITAFCATSAQAGFYMEGESPSQAQPQSEPGFVMPQPTSTPEPLYAPAYPEKKVEVKKTPADIFPTSEKGWIERQYDSFIDWSVRVVNGDYYSDTTPEGYPRRNAKSSLDRKDLGEEE